MTGQGGWLVWVTGAWLGSWVGQLEGGLSIRWVEGGWLKGGQLMRLKRLVCGNETRSYIRQAPLRGDKLCLRLFP